MICCSDVQSIAGVLFYGYWIVFTVAVKKPGIEYAGVCSEHSALFMFVTFCQMYAKNEIIIFMNAM